MLYAGIVVVMQLVSKEQHVRVPVEHVILKCDDSVVNGSFSDDPRSVPVSRPGFREPFLILPFKHSNSS